MPNGELTLQEPPTLPEKQASTSTVFTYLPMALASTATILIFVRPNAGIRSRLARRSRARTSRPG